MSVQALSCAFAIRGISSSEKLVLLALANFANEKMECWPSQERLAADTELGERTVWTALRNLETAGLLSREKRNRSDGTRTTDRFVLHFALTLHSEPVATVAKSTRKSCENQSQTLHEPVATVATLTTFEPSIEEPKKEESASRLPQGWVPDPCDFLKAFDLVGPERAATELEKFTDYWRAVPGAKGRKLDWSATYRNWIRRTAESTPRNAKSDKLTAKHDNLERGFRAAERASQFVAANRTF